jgi:hypothetical protein
MKPIAHLDIDKARITESLRQVPRKAPKRARDVAPERAQVTAQGKAVLQRKMTPPQP